ncbi:hypothetical protein OS493_021521 [Desmophyllum pertusum]|uniref:Uncharacterized protein n=1 Tax=Desmophyllum pertusum TaxID=174260 RepID=A0A9W9YNW3_9CNID|nr:hypothetical protein OS493_021521 [Desmophyllum pertusum]
MQLGLRYPRRHPLLSQMIVTVCFDWMSTMYDLCCHKNITALPPVLKVVNEEISIQERPDPAEVMYQLKGAKLSHFGLI